MSQSNQELYAMAYGPIGRPWGATKYRTIESLNGSIFYMPTKIQISLPGETLEYYQLPNEPLISVSGSKTIIKTSIDGTKGTFKQGFAINDYKVSIRGLAIQEDPTTEDYPEEVIRKIRRVIEIQKSLAISNEMLAIFGINRIVIEDWDFPEFPGAPSVQPYVLNCLSDQEFDLELKQNMQ